MNGKEISKHLLSLPGLPPGFRPFVLALPGLSAYEQGSAYTARTG